MTQAFSWASFLLERFSEHGPRSVAWSKWVNPKVRKLMFQVLSTFQNAYCEKIIQSTFQNAYWAKRVTAHGNHGFYSLRLQKMSFSQALFSWESAWTKLFSWEGAWSQALFLKKCFSLTLFLRTLAWETAIFWTQIFVLYRMFINSKNNQNCNKFIFYIKYVSENFV